jgi:dTDP-L-rhamnose 4-epimerase
LDNLSEQVHDKGVARTPPNQSTFFYIADIRDAGAVKKILEKNIDILIHLAAETGTGQSMYEVEKYVSVNDYGTSAIIQAIIESKKMPRKIILTSSRSVYGEGAYIDKFGSIKQPAARSKINLDQNKWNFCDVENPLTPIPTPEDLPYDPKSIYAATKVSQEILLKIFCESIGIPLTILRLQNVYGAGQSLKNPYTGIISIFYNKSRQGIYIPVYEDGFPVRDFIYIDDVVDAILLAINSNQTKVSTYNIGTGSATTVYELAKKIIERSGINVEIKITGQYRLGDIRYCIADTTKATRELGFTSKINLQVGLSKFICN